MQSSQGQGKSISPQETLIYPPHSSYTECCQCDRIQPCTACSLHQIAELCEFDLSEAERQPILQAEALKERDKTIANLRNEMAILRGEPIKAEPTDDNIFARSGQKIKLPPKVTRKASPPPPPLQLHNFSGEMNDNIYFGSPGMTSVVEEVSARSLLGIHLTISLKVWPPVCASRF